MVLYHVASTYQLLCAIVHRKQSHEFEKSVLILADFMADIYKNYEELAPDFFDEIYLFPYGEIEHNEMSITENVIKKYYDSVRYDLQEFDKIYMLGAHFFFSELLLYYRRTFICFEEAAGMLSDTERLEKIIRKKYNVQADWAKKNGLIDLSNDLITKIYCLKKYQKYETEKMVDFNVVSEFEKSDVTFREKCIGFFLNKRYEGGIDKCILITEHLSNLGVLSEEEQIQFYLENVCLKYREEQIIIKPHPSDVLNYRKIFPNARVLEEKFPSEFLPFIFEDKPNKVITIGSTAVRLLEPYFDVEYIGENNWRNVVTEQQQIYKEITKETKMNTLKEHINPAYTERNIPIAISCSNEYVKYLSVLLQSILDNASDTNNYDVLILNRGIDDRNKFLIEQQCNRENFSVRFVSILEYIEGENFYTEGLSIEAYFRMFLTDIMHCYDKTLYLDVDTFALTDVAEVLNIDIGNNYIAAAIDINIVASYVAQNHWKPYIDDVIKLDNPHEYVQSGVMVLNLKKLREDFSLEFLIKASTKENWRLYDQDVLNHICKNNIFFLDPVYNVINIQEGRLQNIQKYAPENLQKDFFEAYQKPKIVHFVGKKKPWFSLNTDYAEHFWMAARKTPFYENLLIGRITKIDLSDIKNKVMQVEKSIAKTPAITTPEKVGAGTQKVAPERSKFRFENKSVNNGQVALFRCQSVYQLMNALIIKTTALDDISADIILTKATEFGDIAKKLVQIGVFRNVIFSDDTPKTYLDWRGFDVKEQREICEKPEKYILPVNIEKDYTDYYIAVSDEYNKIFYYYMLQKGISTKIHFFEDGMNSYILNNVELCKNDFINHEYYGDLAFDKKIEEHLVYETSVIVDMVPGIRYNYMKKIDSLPKNSIKALSKLFDKEMLPKQKYIFLEEAFFKDGIASTDVELLEEIAEIVGKENIIVKLHPRNTVDRFTARGFAVMENTTVPWEMVMLNNDVSQKVFLTISSTAAISAGLSFNKKFKSIYMYKVMSLGMNIHVRQKKFVDFMQKAKKYVNTSELQIMIPNSFDELKEDLIYVEKERA